MRDILLPLPPFLMLLLPLLTYSTHVKLQVLIFLSPHPPQPSHNSTYLQTIYIPPPRFILLPPLHSSTLHLLPSLQVIPLKPLRLLPPLHSFHLLLSCTHVIQTIKSTWPALSPLIYPIARGFLSFLHSFSPL